MTPQGKKPRPTAQKIAQQTDAGCYYLGDVTEVLGTRELTKLRGKIQLILTSPPFPLNNKKSYGNLNGDEYLAWFTSLAPIFADYLSPKGSIVVELGNAWEPARPVQSLLHLKALMGFVEHPKADLRLCQQFVCYNPSRLPSPAAWVTIKRIRTVDSFTHVWWMAKDDFPTADNAKVLRPYSKSMDKLLKRQTFNGGSRPSEHNISEKAFLKNCGGSIAHNFLEVEALDLTREHRLPNAFSFSNTSSNDFFSRTCQGQGIIPHPARMPMGLAAFFIQYLTEPGDLVLDPFAGSNTTGYAAESLGRKWVAIDAQAKYAKQSEIRFKNPALRSQVSSCP